MGASISLDSKYRLILNTEVECISINTSSPKAKAKATGGGSGRKARKDRDRAEGQLEAAMERLHEEFGCETVEAGEKLARTLKAEAVTAEAAYDEAVEAFETAWEAQLED